LERIGRQAEERWSLTDVEIVHRIGELQIGEASVVIAVGAPHRAEAFEACRYIIDTLKTTVPIWKKEWYRDGAVWIEPTAAG
ncbi:MAG: molybdenum cofactor biosynthesis protein MoaE, partial [Chloroflexi bacterium]|nr:molybdenum cofactor biosynthesis protein MoaE [Chloroflexota bacterium]